MFCCSYLLKSAFLCCVFLKSQCLGILALVYTEVRASLLKVICHHSEKQFIHRWFLFYLYYDQTHFCPSFSMWKSRAIGTSSVSFLLITNCKGGVQPVCKEWRSYSLDKHSSCLQAQCDFMRAPSQGLQ